MQGLAGVEVIGDTIDVMRDVYREEFIWHHIKPTRPSMTAVGMLSTLKSLVFRVMYTLRSIHCVTLLCSEGFPKCFLLTLRSAGLFRPYPSDSFSYHSPPDYFIG